MSAVRRELVRVFVAIIAASASHATAGPIREGYDAAALPAADPSPESGVQFFAHTFDALHVNARGNVAFAAPLPSFSPLPIGEVRDANITPYFTKDGVYRLPRPGHEAAFVSTEGSKATPAATIVPTGGNNLTSAISPANPGTGRSATGPGPAQKSSNYGAWFAPHSQWAGSVSTPDNATETTPSFTDPLDPVALARILLDPRVTDNEPSFTNDRSGLAANTAENPTPTTDLGATVGTPEPGTLVLGTLGAVSLLAFGRRRATSPPSPVVASPRL